MSPVSQSPCWCRCFLGTAPNLSPLLGKTQSLPGRPISVSSYLPSSLLTVYSQLCCEIGAGTLYKIRKRANGLRFAPISHRG